MAINLIPQEEKSISSGKNYSELVKAIIISVVTIVGVLLVFGGQFFINEAAKNDIKTQENSMTEKENSVKNFKDAYSTYKSFSAQSALASHPYYSKFLDKLDSTIPNNVRINTLKTDNNLTATADTLVTGTYTDVSAFLKTLKKAGFYATIKNLGQPSEGKISLSIEFKIDRGIIYL